MADGDGRDSPVVADPRCQEQVLDELFDGVYFVDNDRKITYWSRGAERITGYTRDEVIGRHCCDNLLVHVDSEARSICQTHCPLNMAMSGTAPWEDSLYFRHRDGHRVPVEVRSRPIRDPAGEVIGAVEVFRERPSGETLLERVHELERLAVADPLTRLANRRHSEEMLTMRLQEMSRYGWPFGVLFVDIDGFKNVNDTRGHEVGDRVLLLAARTMVGSLRPFDFLGRWGGDEFLAIVVNVDEETLFTIAERTRALMATTRLEEGGETIRVTVSVGVAVAHPGDTAEQLVARADKAMYASKTSGRNRVTALPGGPSTC